MLDEKKLTSDRPLLTPASIFDCSDSPSLQILFRDTIGSIHCNGKTNAIDACTKSGDRYALCVFHRSECVVVINETALKSTVGTDGKLVTAGVPNTVIGKAEEYPIYLPEQKTNQKSNELKFAVN